MARRLTFCENKVVGLDELVEGVLLQLDDVGSAISSDKGGQKARQGQVLEKHVGNLQKTLLEAATTRVWSAP